jgi:hypothetical protein
MTIRPLVKAVAFALAEMEYGRQARGLGIFFHPYRGLVIQ